MNRQSWLLNLSLLKTHPAFRAVFIARFISILSLGLLGVAIPVQIQMMTHSTWQVGLSVTLTGASMFVGLMIGGVLADRYERKRLILLARGTCGIGFVGLCLNAMLPEPSLIAIYLLGIWDGLFASIGVTALLAATPALVGRENLMQAGAITMLTVRLGSVISPMIGGLLLATGGVAWNYGLAAAGSFITTLSLLRLPLLAPPPQPREHPLKSLNAGLKFLFNSPLIGGHRAAWRSADDGQRGARALSGAGRKLADVGVADWPALCCDPTGRGIRGTNQRATGADGEAGRADAGDHRRLVCGDCAVQPDAGVGAGRAVSGAVWLAKRDKLAAAIYADSDPDPGKYARAHQRSVDRAERDRRCDRRGAARRPGRDPDAGGLGERQRLGAGDCGRGAGGAVTRTAPLSAPGSGQRKLTPLGFPGGPVAQARRLAPPREIGFGKERC
ncbi:enterobactin exporter EntS [Klebsiella michiganensis]|nr:enterobactin exporter EntS [Klebsiella michiganensis]